jgi:hypothetical protein
MATHCSPPWISTGDAPEIVRAVQLIEIDENLNRRFL